MKPTIRHRADLPGISGTARVERRTRALLSRVRAGDIAVVDHLDMDRVTAQALIEADVSAVLNVSQFISGRYPNLGPQLLDDAGIVLVDGIGAEGLVRIRDGARVRIHDGTVFAGEKELASGRRLDSAGVRSQMTGARAGLASQLDSFAHNTSEYLRREQDLLLHGTGAPRLSTSMSDRPVVVVVRAHDHRAELRAVRRFIREQRPVLIGVDQGADALLEAGHRPDVVLVTATRDADGVELPSTKALRGARDVVIRLDRGAGSRSSELLERLGVRPSRFETGSTSEDAALMLAELGEASLIVGVGMSATLDEFLDQQRAGLASTFLTRLRVGPKLVDARSVPQLYAGRIRTWQILLVLLACLVALVAALSVTPVGQAWAESLQTWSSGLLVDAQGLFS